MRAASKRGGSWIMSVMLISHKQPTIRLCKMCKGDAFFFPDEGKVKKSDLITVLLCSVFSY